MRLAHQTVCREVSCTARCLNPGGATEPTLQSARFRSEPQDEIRPACDPVLHAALRPTDCQPETRRMTPAEDVNKTHE